MSLFVYCFFVYNMSNMSLFCMSCIICLNEIYFVCVLAGSPVVLAVNYGLPETHIPSGEPITHRYKDHHSYVMVVHKDKLYRSDQHDALPISNDTVCPYEPLWHNHDDPCRGGW